VSIVGTNLFPVTDDWSHSIVNGTLPISLDGVSVSMGRKPAYVYHISPGQINVLAPDISSGPGSVTVTTATVTSAALTATVSQYGPAFFLWPASQVVATHLDYSYAVQAVTFSGLTTVPAKPGEAIVLWATGFGLTSPAAPDGVVVSSTPTYGTLSGACHTRQWNPAHPGNDRGSLITRGYTAECSIGGITAHKDSYARWEVVAGAARDPLRAFFKLVGHSSATFWRGLGSSPIPEAEK